MQDPQTGLDKLSRSYAWDQYVGGGIGGLLSITTYQTDGATPDKTYLPLYDGGGNVTGLVDAATRTVVATYEYDPFGNTLSATGDAAALAANPFRFSTKYSDAETGLYYYGYRYYAPQLGRWMTRDPMQEEGGVNVYGFVNNDPINQIDADGGEPRRPEHIGWWLEPGYDEGLKVAREYGPEFGHAYDRLAEAAWYEGQKPYATGLASPNAHLLAALQKNPLLWARLRNSSPWIVRDYAAGRRDSMFDTAEDVFHREYLQSYAAIEQQIEETYADPEWVRQISTRAGGLAQAALSTAALIVTAPLALTPGAAAPLTAADNVQAGLRTLVTGNYSRTAVSASTAKAAEFIGVDRKNAYVVGEVTNISVSTAAFVDGYSSISRLSLVPRRVSLRVLNANIPAEWSVVRQGELVTVRYGDIGMITGRGNAAYGRVAQVAVEPAFQGRGVGTELYRRLLPEIENPRTIEGVPAGDNLKVLETPGKTIYDTPRVKILSNFGYDQHSYDGLHMRSSRSGG